MKVREKSIPPKFYPPFNGPERKGQTRQSHSAEVEEAGGGGRGRSEEEGPERSSFKRDSRIASKVIPKVPPRTDGTKDLFGMSEERKRAARDRFSSRAVTSRVCTFVR